MDGRTRSIVTRVGIGLAGLTTAAAVAVPLGTPRPEEVHSRPASHVEPAPQQAAVPATSGAQAPQQAPAVTTDTGVPPALQAQQSQQARQGTSADSRTQSAQRGPEIATPPANGCITTDATGAPLYDSQYEQRTGHAPC
jgi:hypothetical protein